MTNVLAQQAQRAQDMRQAVLGAWRQGGGGYDAVTQAQADFDGNHPATGYLHAAEAMTPAYSARAWAGASPTQQQQILNAIPSGRTFANPWGLQEVAGAVPQGLPDGSQQIGWKGGAPVWRAPDGSRHLVQP